MLALPLWFALPGCPWVSPAAHRDNQARLDQDTDVDTDADADTDTVHTGTVCVEDPAEPNDTLAQAEPVALGAPVSGVSCGGNPDHFSAAVGEREVLVVTLACEGEAVLRVFADGVAWEALADACGEKVRLGLGSGTYAVEVLGPDGSDLPYTLALATEECLVDDDLDGQPSAAACPGGADCDDTAGGATTRLGGTDTPGNGIDEDCDGADDLLRQPRCNAIATGFVVPGIPDLPCGAPDVDPVWHHVWFRVDPADAVTIFLTPLTDPQADLYALYTDSAGRYGLDPGEDELDGEEACRTVEGDCPSTCLVATGGRADLWIAQRSCTAPTTYQLQLSIGTGAVSDVSSEFGVPGPPGAR